jgi:prepilin-type N-terminal cleavage/methylation domain-containing protein
MKFKFNNRKQAGMTMVELVIAVAISGIIMAFLGTAIYHTFTVSDYGNNRNTALHELQNTAFWFKFDGQKAMAASGGSQLILTNADNSTITYALTGTELLRSSTGSDTILARNITSLAFSVNNRLITMSLTSNPDSREDVSANGTYMVYIRLEGGG